MEFTEEEHIDFGDNKRVNTSEISKISSSLVSKLPKVSIRSTGKGKIKPLTLVFILVLVALGISIFFTLRNKDQKKDSNSETVPVVVTSGEEQKSEVEAEKDEKSVNPDEDEKNKVSRVKAEVFYDIKIVDEAVVPTSLAVLDNDIVLTDSISGKLFISNLNTPKFELSKDTFTGISGVAYFGGDLVFKDNEGYKVYDTEKVTESYSLDTAPFAPYLSFVYAVKDTSILKYTKSGQSLVSSTWTTDSAISNVRSLAIDGNIYLLKSDGSILKYYSGEKSNFQVAGLDKPLNNPMNLIKDLDLTNIYVSDKGNGRVVVLDTDGNLVRQYLPENGTWNDLNGVSVSRDEKTLYILNGTKVYYFNVE